MGLFNNNPNNRNNAPSTSGTPALSRQNLILIGIVVIAAIIFLPRLLNTNNNTTPTPDPDTEASDFDIADVVTSTGITNAGCASDATDSFSPDDRIYLVAENSDFPANTGVFGRLYFEGNAVEDTNEIVSDRDYTDSCFNVWFESDNGFESGEYTAQFFINGNAGPEVNLEVQ
jgi:hypothetical protein